MVNSIIAANQIKGLIPTFDPRNLTAAALLDGSRNVMVDFKGPYAAFASRIFTYNKFYSPLQTQSFRITNNDEIIFMQGAAFQFDWASQRLYCVYTFVDPDQIWPLSYAVVDSIFYFEKKGLNGILRFDPSINEWSTVTDNVPSSPLAVTQ